MGEQHMDKPLMLVVKKTYKEWSNHMKKIAAQVGVPDSYRMILTFLLRHPGSNVKDLAAHCDVTTSSISQTIKEMELTGYIRKAADDDDLRFLRLNLTEKGTETAEKIREKFREANSKITESIGEEKEKELISLMHRLSEIIEKELS